MVIAAIFGTSILRDFQRDTYQTHLHQTHHQVRLSRRSLGRFLRHRRLLLSAAWSSARLLGTFAPWADHTRIAPGHLGWYLQPFLAITVVQIFFLGSLFFAVAALTRKLFIVYLQGVVVFLAVPGGEHCLCGHRFARAFLVCAYSIPSACACSTVSPATGRLREKQLYSCNCRMVRVSFSTTASSGVALACSLSSPLYDVLPLSVEALTARSHGRRAARDATDDAAEAMPARSLVAKRLPVVHQIFGPATTLVAVPVAHSPAHLEYPARDSLLGHRRRHARVRSHQRPLRRPHAARRTSILSPSSCCWRSRAAPCSSSSSSPLSTPAN